MKIRVAIVGFGFMGQMHAKVYQALENVEIVGIVDPFPAAVEAAAQYGFHATFSSSIESLLNQTAVDIIDICLPTDLHANAIVTAAQAGKHIFCEKPFALTIAEAERSLAAVETAGVHFQVGQCIRFWPEYQALEAYLKSGQGGRLTSLWLQRRASKPGYSQENWLHTPHRSKGAALDLHIHDTDFILHLLGKPHAVHSIGHKVDGAYAHLFTQYHYDQIAVTAQGGWDYPAKWGFQMAFQAVFEHAVIEMDSLTSPSLHITQNDQERVAMPFAKLNIKSHGPTSGNISDLGGYYNELASFVEGIRKGIKPSIATGPQALESLRTVLAEIQSADENRSIIL
ncbi:MAG: hypothetical protein B9S32_03510 [Verrucomicrobia bacterium Tous-C9LFEB]|nr:MAG: hypothetical protein B9S32_03510 [Verrucomicrobia bacterium Tous-C9LFEB]